MHEYESITPEEARDWYVEDREDELAEATLKAHQYRLAPFLEWCELEGIEELRALGGRDFSKYKIWRKNSKGHPNNVTLNTQLCTLRVFIKWAGKRELVPRDLYEYIDPPRMAPNEDVRTVTLGPEEAADLLHHLRTFEYASRDHLMVELLWSVGMRQGALRALDLEDYVPNPPSGDDANGPYLCVRHRPETDTPLKNGELGQRDVSLKPELRDLLNDYIETKRVEIEDEHGRRPLLTTSEGRPARGTIRRAMYALTRPCFYRGSCPVGREISECDEAQSKMRAYKCPKSISSHAVRKGAITWARLNDVPLEAISDRMDVSPKVLKKHYDRRTTTQQMESRRAYFDSL